MKSDQLSESVSLSKENRFLIAFCCGDNWAEQKSRLHLEPQRTYIMCGRWRGRERKEVTAFDHAEGQKISGAKKSY